MIKVKWLLVGALSLLLISLFTLTDDYAGICTKCRTPTPFSHGEERFDISRKEVQAKEEVSVVSPADPTCQGRRIYIYPLPPEFNEEILRRCTTGYPEYCEKWPCVSCDFVENKGFGSKIVRDAASPQPQEEELIKLIPASAWYRTNQFSLEVIFHEKLRSYKCRTTDAGSADAFYIPFYAGIELGFTLFSPHLNVRDEMTQRLMGWLSGNDVWRRQRHEESGWRRNRHFMPLGRIAWDFNRDPLDGGTVKWGNSLLRQRPMANVTTLVLERKFQRNPEIGVPYPTLFHPTSDDELDRWRAAIARHKRRWLVTFVGASNRSFDTEEVREIRVRLTAQCEEERNRDKCRVVECGSGTGAGTRLACEREPEEVVRVLAASVFCLQPRGDSATRKGFFDTILAGCIPVVFSNRTAFEQYPYHLAHTLSLGSSRATPFSVFIPEELILGGGINVIHALSLIPGDHIRALQRSVRRLIPNVIYADTFGDQQEEPRYHRPDAFSIAIDALLDKLPPPPPISGMNILL